METQSGCFPEEFPHSSFADAVNSNIVESEIFGGVALRDLSVGAELEVLTENRCYLLTYCGADTAYISGHPVFCPQPVLVRIHGSTWGGAMIRRAFIGRGMHLEFRHPQDRTITTSKIVEIREHAAA